MSKHRIWHSLNHTRRVNSTYTSHLISILTFLFLHFNLTNSLHMKIIVIQQWCMRYEISQRRSTIDCIESLRDNTQTIFSNDTPFQYHTYTYTFDQLMIHSSLHLLSICYYMIGLARFCNDNCRTIPVEYGHVLIEYLLSSMAKKLSRIFYACYTRV
jgi:hypothetical protein